MRAAITRFDVGLLVFRLAGLFLLLTFGVGKLLNLIGTIRSGAPLAQSGLAPLMRAAGFPAAGLLGVYVPLCESIAAGLVAVGLFTRASALALTLSMAGACYVSVRLVEDPLRAAVYFLLFGSIALMGPGRLSIDARRAKRVEVTR